MSESDKEKRIKRILNNIADRIDELPVRYIEMPVVKDALMRIEKAIVTDDPDKGIKNVIDSAYILGYVQGIRDKE